MKKLLLILLPLFFTAQTHRFIYEFHYKVDSLAEKPQKQNMVLDVNPDDVKFYPYAYVENDSLNKVRNGKSYYWDDALPAIIRKKNSNTNKSYILSTDFFVLETNDKINWNLTSETKKDGNYNLQKAATNFGGRNWTAWFTKDIMINEGPYKFRGLPGLIFEVEDDKDQFSFKLVKSLNLKETYKTNEFLESFAGKKPIPITEKIYFKKQLELYNDPLNDLKVSFKENNNPEKTFYCMGIQIKSADQFKELSEHAQKRMRQENNPIELDKAVKFPLK